MRSEWFIKLKDAEQVTLLERSLVLYWWTCFQDLNWIYFYATVQIRNAVDIKWKVKHVAYINNTKGKKLSSGIENVDTRRKMSQPDHVHIQSVVRYGKTIFTRKKP